MFASEPSSAPDQGSEARDEPYVFTVPEAARLLGISRNLAYQLVRDGDLPAKRLRGRLVISRHAFERWLQE